MRGEIVLILLLALAVPVAAETPAESWQAVVQATPTVVQPEMLVLLVGRDLVIQWRAPLTIDVAGRLKYDVTLNDQTVQGFAPAPKVGGYVIAGVLGALVGALTVALLAK